MKTLFYCAQAGNNMNDVISDPNQTCKFNLPESDEEYAYASFTCV